MRVKFALFSILFCLGILLDAAAAQDTNPTAIQLWYQTLTNRMGGSCCGESDAYPAEIIKEPTPESYESDGVAEIVDPSGKDIWVKGVLIKMRPALTGNLTVHFNWYRMTREVYGNPLGHAIVFVNVNSDGTIHEVYCVVIVPPLG